VGELSITSAAVAPLKFARLRWSNDAKLRRVGGLLPPEQRQVLELWSSGTVSTRALARVLGCNHGVLVRRLHAILRRLGQPIALQVAAKGHELSPAHRDLAIRMFIHGQAQCRIARDLRLSMHEVRQRAAEIRGWSVSRTH
jgi:hypothetical protein